MTNICKKCRKRINSTCPFKEREREKIINCNKYEPKDRERQLRRWAKFEEKSE